MDDNFIQIFCYTLIIILKFIFSLKSASFNVIVVPFEIDAKTIREIRDGEYNDV